MNGLSVYLVNPKQPMLRINILRYILEVVLNLLRNNIIISSRYVPAILSPCLAS